MADFHIVTRGLPALADDWIRSTLLPEEELPVLTEDDRRRARMRLGTEEQYRRTLAFRNIARAREAVEGEVLGRAVAQLLQELNAGDRLLSVEKRGGDAGWHLLIESEGGAARKLLHDVHFGCDILGREATGSERNPVFTAHYLRDPLFRALGRENLLRAAS